MLCGLAAVVFATFYSVLLVRAENCPGFRQTVTVPLNYDKHAPNVNHAHNAREIQFSYYIKQIKAVEEER